MTKDFACGEMHRIIRRTEDSFLSGFPTILSLPSFVIMFSDIWSTECKEVSIFRRKIRFI